MNRISWAQIGAFAAIVLVILLVGITALPLLFGAYGGWGMMGPGMMGGEWTGGWCPFCGGTGRLQGGMFGGMFGWFFMLVAILFPLGFLVLVILGIVWLVRAVTRSPSGRTPLPQACPKCGKAVEADWRLCPHCGEKLQEPE